jgi:hypothetical protein
VSKSRIKRWVGYVACVGDRRVADLREREHLIDIGIMVEVEWEGRDRM